MKSVGFPIVVADCWDEVEAISKYKTTRKGGHGAVREICDLIYNTVTKNNE